MVQAGTTRSVATTEMTSDLQLDLMAEQMNKIRGLNDDVNFDESMIPQSGNPMDLFKEWFDLAVSMKMFEPNAFSLATSTKDGKPSNRMSLCNYFNDEGFVWYTNYESRKGQEIDENPLGAATFWWGPLER